MYLHFLIVEITCGRSPDSSKLLIGLTESPFFETLTSILSYLSKFVPQANPELKISFSSSVGVGGI